MNQLKILILSFSFLFLHEAFAQKSEAPYKIGASDLYEFYSHFWLNMHHFLKQEALLNLHADSSIIDSRQWNKLDTAETKQLKLLIHYYTDNFVDLDLRTDDYMYDFKNWVIKYGQNLDSIPAPYQEHVEKLMQGAKIYEEHFWPIHNNRNKEVLATHFELLQKTEKNITQELSYLTKSEWQEEKVRVDICYFASSSKYNLRNRPYTNLWPTHIVMNSGGKADIPKGNWLELMYHESSHNLIGTRTGFVAGTIADVAEKLDIKSPRGLWHAYLFYFSGKLTQKVLLENGWETYDLYMVRNRVFFRYFPYLDEYLTKYIEKQSTLHDVTENIIKSLSKK